MRVQELDPIQIFPTHRIVQGRDRQLPTFLKKYTMANLPCSEAVAYPTRPLQTNHVCRKAERFQDDRNAQQYQSRRRGDLWSLRASCTTTWELRSKDVYDLRPSKFAGVFRRIRDVALMFHHPLHCVRIIVANGVTKSKIFATAVKTPVSATIF